MEDKRPRFRSKADRDLLALAIAFDPTMIPALRKMLRMGVRHIRADYMHVRRPDGIYDTVPDPGAWSGDINRNVGIMLLRNREGEWWLNGF